MALSISARWSWFQSMQKQLDSDLKSDESGTGYLFLLSVLFSYFSTVIVGLTIENLSFAIVGVLCVLILLVDIRMSLFVIIIIIMIDIDLIAWMVINNIALDFISFSELVMAVGLTVDYIVHVAHSIAHANPTPNMSNMSDMSLNEYKSTFKTRLIIAFKDMGVGVAKGALTTFLGTMTLIFSQSEAFRVFFLMLCGIVMIGVLHGFILIPALMAQMPFVYSHHCNCARCYRS